MESKMDNSNLITSDPLDKGHSLIGKSWVMETGLEAKIIEYLYAYVVSELSDGTFAVHHIAALRDGTLTDE
jgi:hypothetical protein